MKRTRQTRALEYQRRISKGLAFIQKNLDRPISLNEVARAACFSEFHFHRIFSAVMREPLGEYITRKRLERAAFRLAYTPAMKVSGIAEESGYTSVSSFSKAFNGWFGCRPSAFKEKRLRLDSGCGKLQIRYRKPLESSRLFVSLDDSANQFDKLNKKIEIGSHPEMVVSYLTCPQGYNFLSIWETWAELRRRVEAEGLDWGECGHFALSHEHPGLSPSEHCRYDACVSLPAGVTANLDLPKTVIPAGVFAVFSVEGPDHSILGQYLEFLTLWMPQSGYVPDNFPMVEHYLPATGSGYVVAELWVKLTQLSIHRK